MIRLNPVLTSPERLGHLAAGAGLLAFAVWGGLDQVWLRAIVAAFGVVFLIGGVGGT
jgi:hypothetical protein